MDVVARSNQVSDSEPNEVQIDKYQSDVRDSLATTNKLSTATHFLSSRRLVTYCQVSFAGATGFT